MKELVEYQQTDAYRSFVAKQEIASKGGRMLESCYLITKHPLLDTVITNLIVFCRIKKKKNNKSRFVYLI